MRKKIVFVGLSGGVDSAVSAALLQKTGYEVVGVFIRTWHPEFLECNEEEERRDAMRVAAHLDIPFLTFDLEDVKKKEVRRLAKKFKLPNALKKDSQGICFLGAVDLKEFLRHYIKEKKGKVLNQKGEEIGFHNGVVFHTLGERHGFTITQKGSNDHRYYVVGKNIKKNILVVGTR